jgi:aflatoxin B1 aldehyde reductase
MFRALACHTSRHRLSSLSQHLSSPTNTTITTVAAKFTTTPSTTMPLLTPSTTKPRVILGLMTFGPPGTEDKGARITSLSDYNTCLDTLQSRGYNEIDTARVYISGQQESFTRDAKWKDRGLTLATKCYPTSPGHHSKDRLKETLNKSLKELDTDCVDIFYLHAPDRSVPFKETMEACNELFKEGKFVKLGLSNFAAWEVAECWNIANENGWCKPTIYQAMYNAITRNIEEELVPCCRKYGIDLVVYNPVSYPTPK